MAESARAKSVRARVVVSGRVQGVSFRAWTYREASKLGVNGWVRNKADGSVEVMLEGPAQEVQDLIVWAHHGPPSAEVDNVKVTWENYTGEYDSFSVY